MATHPIDLMKNKKALYVLLLTALLFQPAISQSALIDPAIRFQQVEGWGGSLCWWANIMGGYSDTDVLKVCDWITDPKGLNMNIFRFNIGGGDDPSHAHMRGDGGDMPGYKVSATAPYDWSRDANQRKITEQLIASRIRQTGQNDVILEAFSNSPPWWMTRSGCSAGSVEGNVGNLKADMFDDFADYLTEVVKYYHDSLGITFRTLEPFNEPFSTWWKALGGQEGCYFGQADQEKMIRILHETLRTKGMLSYCGISAMDANSLDECLSGVRGYLDATDILPKMVRINAHSYFGSNSSRSGLAAFSHENSITLWQSETGPLNMSGSAETLILAMAARTIKDMREMKCEAWIDWQLAADNSPTWGLIVGKYNEPNHPIAKGDAYYIRSQFSRFIKPGYSIIDCKDPNSLTAISPDGTELIVVIVNETATERSQQFDLSAFKTGGTAERYRSGKVNDSYIEKLAKVNVTLSGGTLDYTAPKYSVTTFVIPVEVSGAPVTRGRYTIKNKAGNVYIGILGASASPGVPLVVSGESAGAGSLFDITQDPIAGGYVIRPAHLSADKQYVLDVEGVSNLDRARIMQYPDWGGENQRFHFVRLEGDLFRIMIRKSMKCWSLPDQKYTAGSNVLQMTWDQSDASIWEIREAPSSSIAFPLQKTLDINYQAPTLNVRTTDQSCLQDLHIFNSMGETIRYLQDIGNAECSLRITVNPGIYYVTATLADGYTANSKFIGL
jgi:O-glycosyl hydrolase